MKANFLHKTWQSIITAAKLMTKISFLNLFITHEHEL